MATINVKDAAGATVAIEKPLVPGAAAAAASRPVTASTEDVARTGIITETAPASDTASSGLNGRLQRVAQRITSMIALLPAALGAGGGLKVDGSGTALPVSAASLPLPALAATSTKQSDGSHKTQVVDGSGNVIGSTSNALDINIKSGSSSGTQYTEDAAAAADPVGTALIGVRRDTLSASEVSADGDNVAAKMTSKGQLHVTDADLIAAIAGVAHDAVVTAVDPVLVGGGASAAAPSAVSADGDMVRAWYLRNGAQASVVTAAGALIGGDAANGLDVDVTRVSGNVAVTNVKLSDAIAGEYETVAASQTAQALGATGATGDYVSGILVIPATTSPGVVTLLDNATSIPVFVGGASSVSNLVPFFIPLGMYSVSGAWKITTGTNVSCIGIGNFT